eukprot:1989473-Prymnesium_polylepis.1
MRLIVRRVYSLDYRRVAGHVWARAHIQTYSHEHDTRAHGRTAHRPGIGAGLSRWDIAPSCVSGSIIKFPRT